MKFATGPAAIIAARWRILLLKRRNWRYRFGAFIQHFDVAAQRDQGDDILDCRTVGTTPTLAKNRWKSAQLTFRRTAEMTKFMHSDQHAQCVMNTARFQRILSIKPSVRAS